MTTPNDPENSSSTSADSDRAQVELALSRVVGSALFSHADRQTRFLQYVVTRTLAGAGDRLNQHVVAQEVFDRDEHFDPAIDSIVRVEAGRLRARLREYYDEIEPDARVRITIPKRGYSANFVVSDDAPRPVKPMREVRNIVVAVLRFDNMSTSPDQDYFADGLTEDLITDIARIKGIEVVSRNSSFAHSTAVTVVTETCRALGADYLVEGSVRRSASRVRITAQLIDGMRDVQLWAERYDYDYEDIFSLQDDVARRIVDALRTNLPTRSRPVLSEPPTVNIAAQELVYRGRAVEQQSGRDSHLHAMALYEAAISLDSNYCVAHAHASLNAVFQWVLGFENDHASTLHRGLELADQAIALRPDLACGHTARSFASMWNGDSAGALEAGRHALAVDESDLQALQVITLVSAWAGELSAAEEFLQKIERLDPQRPHHFSHGVVYFMKQDYRLAIEALEKASNNSPKFLPIWLYLAASYTLGGRLSCGRDAIGRLRQLSPNYELSESKFTNFKYEADNARLVSALIQAGL